jgi:hypothetical protein
MRLAGKGKYAPKKPVVNSAPATGLKVNKAQANDHFGYW